jgi:nitrite reductase/ring-hydroxylating ferredoxin subunit
MADCSDGARWIRVARASDIGKGDRLRVSVEGEDIAIFNAEGTLHALGDVCTHAEASLTDGDFYEDIRGWVAECPMHGSQFDLETGEAVSLPATGNVGKYAVKVEDGEVWLNPDPVVPRDE